MWRGFIFSLLISLAPPSALMIFVLGGIYNCGAIKTLSAVLTLAVWFAIALTSWKIDNISNNALLIIVLSTIAAESIIVFISFFLFTGLSKDVDLGSFRAFFSILVEGGVLLIFYSSAILVGGGLKRFKRR